MKLIFSFILLILSPYAICQNLSYCELDSTKEYVIEYTISMDESPAIYASLREYNSDNIEVKSRKTCMAYPCLYNDKIKSYESLLGEPLKELNEIDNSPNIGRSQIKGIRIEVRNAAGASSLDKLDLSQLDLWRGIEPREIQLIEIKSYLPEPKELLINFSGWSLYEDLAKANSLRSINFNTTYTDKTILNDLQPFSNLEIIEVREFLNFELSNYKRLRRLSMDSPLFLFAQNLLDVPTLEHYETIPKVANHSVAPESAEISFFLNHINHKENSSGYQAVLFFDSLVEVMVKDYLLSDGSAILRYSDLDDNFPAAFASDTMAFGTVYNGRCVGIWNYKTVHSKSVSILGNFFQYDHSSTDSIVFPENGDWVYNYPSGQIGIDGSFVDSKKDGEWRFYNPDGSLASVKSFKDDKPNGLFLMYGESEFGEVEQRTFFYNPEEYITVVKNPGENRWVSTNHKVKTGCNETSILCGSAKLCITTKGETKVMTDLKSFKSLLYKHYLKYLYPEQKKRMVLKTWLN